MVLVVLLIVALSILTFVGLLIFVASILTWGESKNYYRSKAVKKFIRMIVKETKRGEIVWDSNSRGNYLIGRRENGSRVDIKEYNGFHLIYQGEMLAYAQFPWNGGLKKLFCIAKKSYEDAEAKKLEGKIRDHLDSLKG